MHKHGSMQRKDGSRAQRYLCLLCRRTYVESTGTPTYRLRKRTEWDQMVMLLAENVALRKMARLLGIQLETAFRWRHRALAWLCTGARAPLSGSVNVSHFLVPYSEKGSRVRNGPGSWGYWNWLQRGFEPQYGAPRPVKRPPAPQARRPRFRLLIDGRPTCVMAAQSDAGYELAILGQERVTPGILAGGLGQLVRAGTEVYAFGECTYEVACHGTDFIYKDGYRSRWEQHSATAEGHGGCKSIRRPDDPVWWMKRFRGVATRYLPHYLVWYRDIARIARSTGGPLVAPGDARRLLLVGVA